MFGGSFDPFHLGHFLIARAAREKFKLHQVLFIPCAHSPLKRVRPTASDSARITMLRSGLRGQTWAKVWDGEIRAQGISYTEDTVHRLSREYPRKAWYWILGSDQWRLLPSWKNPEHLKRSLHFLVFPRPESPRSRRGFRMNEIPLRIDISATEIRHRLQMKLSVTGLVMPVVERLLLRRGWYS